MLNTIDAARAAESYGYERFWVAEHHNAGSLLSSATVVVMAEIAAATERIRVGSGGIMLPNHAPYVVAEQFGTLNAFHPGRIDLGVGRAPGTDPMTAAALRRDDSAAMSFPSEVQQLQRFLGEPSPMHRVHAYILAACIPVICTVVCPLCAFELNTVHKNGRLKP